MIIAIVVARKSKENTLYLNEKQMLTQTPTNQPNMPTLKLHRKMTGNNRTEEKQVIVKGTEVTVATHNCF